MDKQKFLDKWSGKDRLRGRPGRLNQVELKVNSKSYAPLLFFGDVHWGNSVCDENAVIDMLDWVINNKVYMLCMGDMIESGTRETKSLWQQRLNPDKQVDEFIEVMRPVAKAGLIIGYHCGNHEEKITQATSIDISKLICRELKVKYLGYSGWTAVRVTDGKKHQNYSVYSTHGRGGSRFKHTKLKAVADKASWITADIIAMGHLHGKDVASVPYEYIDWKDKQIKQAKSYAVLTGSYLKWAGSYAEDGGYPVNELGSPKAKLRADYKDIHFSL